MNDCDVTESCVLDMACPQYSLCWRIEVEAEQEALEDDETPKR